MSVLVKGAVFTGALALYAMPLELVRMALPVAEVGDTHAHAIRFALTMMSYVWALTISAAWYYAIMVIVVLQTMCWASFIVDERVLAHFGSDVISKDEERALFQTGAIVLYGCMLLLLLFGGSETSHGHYRKKLIAFYSKHNPEKLQDVDRILVKYEGNEELLFTRLHRKYSVLSHTRAEAAVDDVDMDGSMLDDAQAEVEEVELLHTDANREDVHSEEDEGFHLVQEQKSEQTSSSSTTTSASTTVKAVARTIAADDVDTASRTPSPPTQSPSSASGSAKSEAIRAAIDEARRAQEARVQQRIAQLAARSASKTA